MSVSCLGLTLGMPGKPLCIFLWAESKLPCLKQAPQALHSSGLAPVWIYICCMKFCLEVSTLPQSGHGNLQHFRCMQSTWRCKLNFEGKDLEQSGQTKLCVFIFIRQSSPQWKRLGARLGVWAWEGAALPEARLGESSSLYRLVTSRIPFLQRYKAPLQQLQPVPQQSAISPSRPLSQLD